MAFDTKTAALAVVRDLPMGVSPEFTVPVGNRMYMIDSCSQLDYRDRDRGAVHCVKLKDDDDVEKKPVIVGSRKKEEEDPWDRWWCESFHDHERPSRWVWSAHQESLPFNAEEFTCLAVHPGGRAFAVSVDSYHDYRLTALPNRGTFSYDTDKHQWTRHGDWELPFGGQAHYHAALRAWVGLHVVRDEEGTRFKEPDGYLCSCDVLAALGSGRTLDWKLGREKLFLHDPGERHVDAKLVAMGAGGRFCLVEILTRDDKYNQQAVDTLEYKQLSCVLRLTTFGVEYDDDGELVTTSRRPARSYSFSKYHDRFDAQAFWI